MFAGFLGPTILGDCLRHVAPSGAGNVSKSLGTAKGFSIRKTFRWLFTYYHRFTVNSTDASAENTLPGRFGL